MVSWKIWPKSSCWKLNCRICANHPDSGWLARRSNKSFDFSQKVSSLSKATRTAKSFWTVFEPISWMKCFNFCSPSDLRDVRFELWRFKFSQKTNCWCTNRKEKWYMQNNLKTGLHMHSDPQMRTWLQVFYSHMLQSIFHTCFIYRLW